MNSTKNSNEISENHKKKERRRKINLVNPFLRNKDIFDKENETFDKIKVSLIHPLN
jgi:hypothetical protein